MKKFIGFIVLLFLMLSCTGGGRGIGNIGSITPKFESFSIDNIQANINESNISLTVPFGTDVHNLVATFTVPKGMTVFVNNESQTSGVTANDFTNPVTYTVKSLSGQSESFIVTVTIASSSAKAITAFGFVAPAATGTITGTNIAITVPYGTDVTALVATFTASPGATVKVGASTQTSGTTSNDFTNPVGYTVTSADNSTQTYTVTVTVAQDSRLLVFCGTNNSTIDAIIMPTDANPQIVFPVGSIGLNAMSADYLLPTGASIKVDGAPFVLPAALDFTVPHTILVTAQDGISTTSYTLTSRVAGADEKEITSFGFIINGTPYLGTITGSNIDVTVPSGTNVTNLVAYYTSTGLSVKVGAIVQNVGITPNNFTNSVVYNVKAGDTTSNAYAVHVIVGS